MANRSIFYDEQQPDPFDFLWQFKDILAALGAIELDLTGQTTTMATGFAPAPTAPASLTINLTSGRIYQQSVMDSSAYGALPSDSSIVQQQGAAPAQSVTLSTAGLTSGQSMWALVQAQFSQVDVVRTGDPTGGVINFWNAANPTQPFQGPNNDGSSLPTERKATVSIQVIYGSPASTGSEVPPNPTSGWVPLYLVDLAFAQTTITSGQILVAGPSVGSNVPSNYPGAPFLAGLLNQHHKGTPGQAPQIDLTSEVKNILPLLNLLVSSTSGGGIGIVKLNAGNPNGNVAGNFNVNGALDFCVDTTNKLLYFCSATGTSSTAVWTSVSGATTSVFAGGTATGSVNAQVVGSTSPSGFTKSPGQVVTFTGLNNTSATTLNVDGTGASAVEKNTGSGDVPLTGGEMNGFVTAVWTGSFYLLQPGLLGQLATMNLGAWTKNDGSGNITLNVDASLQDNGSGKLQVAPSILPPTGCILPFGGSSAPSGYVLAQGQAISRTTFAALFGVFGIVYGVGDGVTTFNVPDMRGRVPAGVDGGVGRLTTASMSSQALGGTGGTETETLTLAQLPGGITSAGANSISVSGSVSGNVTVTSTISNVISGVVNGDTVGAPGGSNATIITVGSNSSALGSTGSNTMSGSMSGSNTISVTSNNTGGTAHPNVQPTIELNFIIKT
jgi:microcystin-dependent protein